MMRPATKHSISRTTLVPIALGLVLLIVLSACENLFQDSPILADIKNEVSYAKADERSITIIAVDTGSTSPSGTIKAKDGFPVDIEASPDQDYELLGWKKTGGSGTVAWEELGTRQVRLTVSGGNVTIEPVYEERPRILYSLPTGNNIAKNTNVRAVFNREIKLESLDDGNFTLLKAPDNGIEGTISLLSGTAAIFDPDTDLSNYSTHIITLGTGVTAALDLGGAEYTDVFVMNDQITMRQAYTKEFVTGNQLDSTPPVSATVSVQTKAGDQYYTGSGTVYLKDLGADDEGGVTAWMAFSTAWNTKAAQPLATDSGWNAYIPGKVPKWFVDDGTEGRKGINIYFKDGTENVMEQADSVLDVIILDQTPPDFNSFFINNPTFANYVNGTNVTLTYDAEDPDVEAGVPGSGESANGSTFTERKQISFWNWATSTWSEWEAYTDTTTRAYALQAGSDGLRQAQAKIMDAVGNTTEVTDSVILDTEAPQINFFNSANGTTYTNTTSLELYTDVWDENAGTQPGSGVDTIQIATSTGLQAGSAWSADNGGATLNSGTLSGQAATAAYPARDYLTVVLSSGEGAKAIALTVKDKVGNSQTSTSTFYLDTTAPTPGTVSINGGAATTNNATLTLTLSGASDPTSGGVASGIQQIAITSVGNTSGATWQSPASTLSYTMPSPTNQDDNTVYVWYKDIAGNISVAATDTIYYDITPPSGTAYLSTSLTNNPAITVSYTTDAVNIQISNNNSTWTTFAKASYPSSYSWNLVSGSGGSGTNGTRTVYVRFWDGAVGTSNLTTSNPTLVFDNTAPVVSTFTVDGGASYNNTGTTTLTMAATDNLTPTASLYRAFSNNSSAYTGWYAYSTTFSGWSLTSTTYGGSATNGVKTVYFKVTDQAGNTTTVSDTIYFDNVAPVVSSPFIHGTGTTGYENTYTKYATNTLTWTATDNAAGVSYLQFSNDNTSWSGSYSNTGTTSWSMETGAGGSSTALVWRYVYFRAVDAAGNVSATVYDSIYWDNVAPTGSLAIENGSATTTYRSNTYLHPSATDSGTGLADMQFWDSVTGYSSYFPYATSMTNPPWVLPVGNGSKSVYVQFRDRAGNYSPWYSDSITLAENYGSLSFYDIVATYNSSSHNTAYMTGDDFAVNISSASRIYSFTTQAGNIGKMVINYTTLGYNLITYTLWNSAGTQLRAVSNWSVPNSNYLDFETQTYSSSYASGTHDYAQWGTTMYGYNCLSYEWTGL